MGINNNNNIFLNYKLHSNFSNNYYRQTKDVQVDIRLLYSRGATGSMDVIIVNCLLLRPVIHFEFNEIRF